jgi:hypothetical protein
MSKLVSTNTSISTNDAEARNPHPRCCQSVIYASRLAILPKSRQYTDTSSKTPEFEYTPLSKAARCNSRVQPL